MTLRYSFLIVALVLTFACSPRSGEPTITTGSMLNEMYDLQRLTAFPEPGYRAVQYSSYDRRSKAPDQEGWFANEDGFGGEPIPGFQQVLKEPDATGTGEYLICDVTGPGAIVRLWTAGISGRIRLFLDKVDSPLFEGSAEEFFWKTPEILPDSQHPFEKSPQIEKFPQFSKFGQFEDFRQFDAVYFPVPFSKRCRIEWIGKISDLHFYHIGFRLYDHGTKVETFSKDVLSHYAPEILKAGSALSGTFPAPAVTITETPPTNTPPIETLPIETLLPPAQSVELWKAEGMKEIHFLSIRAEASDMEAALRKCVLSIYFDDSQTPQVQAPLGDFFGAAPGINPFQSIPFTVENDGSMICRFIMPFRQNARIVAENHSDQNIRLSTVVRIRDKQWVEGKTMHLRARWRIDHDITASNENIIDVPYLRAHGKGRVVGAATYIYNPSNVPTSWGNWWGEGDEKISVDQDIFPSFFGTGTEDYYNYSWSSARIFSYPYCGQPRNDGPGNRGYVANFRWHILDDIPFSDSLDFKMELRHHGVVPHFSYGRIVYFYAMPDVNDDFRKISEDDLRDLAYNDWKPEAYQGSDGYRFEDAEDLAMANPNSWIEEGNFWAGKKILLWKPVKQGEQLRFKINISNPSNQINLGFTLAKTPEGGRISILVNGKKVLCSGQNEINLFTEYQTVLENYFTEKVNLNAGENEIIFESMNDQSGKKIGVDFIWIKQL